MRLIHEAHARVAKAELGPKLLRFDDRPVETRRGESVAEALPKLLQHVRSEQRGLV